MPRPRKKKPSRPYYLSLAVTKELYEKVQRLATFEHRDASKVLRRLIDEAPEPVQA
jgi:hypothetical protein